jgi:hypothetical protein
VPSPLCSAETLAFTDKSFFAANGTNETVTKWSWTVNNTNTYNGKNINVVLDTGFNK